MRAMLLLVVSVFSMVMLSSVPSQASEAGAKAFASRLADDAITIIQNSNLSKSGKQNKLEQLFSKSVDLQWVAKFVLGKHWRAATKQQRQDYLAYYETFVIRNFTGKLTDYSNQSYDIKQTRPDGEKGEYLITFEVQSPNEPPVYMDYRIRQNGNQYQIFDIIIEGVSLITTQRSEFNAVVDRNGLDYLIAALEKRANS